MVWAKKGSPTSSFSFIFKNNHLYKIVKPAFVLSKAGLHNACFILSAILFGYFSTITLSVHVFHFVVRWLWCLLIVKKRKIFIFVCFMLFHFISILSLDCIGRLLRQMWYFGPLKAIYIPLKLLLMQDVRFCKEVKLFYLHIPMAL